VAGGWNPRRRPSSKIQRHPSSKNRRRRCRIWPWWRRRRGAELLAGAEGRSSWAAAEARPPGRGGGRSSWPAVEAGTPGCGGAPDAARPPISSGVGARSDYGGTGGRGHGSHLFYDGNIDVLSLSLPPSLPLSLSLTPPSLIGDGCDGEGQMRQRMRRPPPQARCAWRRRGGVWWWWRSGGFGMYFFTFLSKYLPCVVEGGAQQSW
jgi:hypothetical protein